MSRKPQFQFALRRLINISPIRPVTIGDIVEGETGDGEVIKGEFIAWDQRNEELGWAFVREMPTEPDATLPAFTTNAPAAADAPGLGESAGVGYTEMDLVHIEELMEKIQAAVYVWRMARGLAHAPGHTEAQNTGARKRREQALITVREEVFRWVREEESRVLPTAIWNETC